MLDELFDSGVKRGGIHGLEFTGQEAVLRCSLGRMAILVVLLADPALRPSGQRLLPDQNRAVDHQWADVRSARPTRLSTGSVVIICPSFDPRARRRRFPLAEIDADGGVVNRDLLEIHDGPLT